MRYQDFIITLSEPRGGSYLLQAANPELGRVSAVLPAPDESLLALMARASALPLSGGDEALLQQVGAAMFRWLMAGPVETHLRVVWDRAQRLRQGLRLRLSIDAADLGSWPWELLYDPEREHSFATSPSTLLVRYFDQVNRFGTPSEEQAELPLDLLLVLPSAPDLDLERERRSLELVAASMPDHLRLRVLEGVVTRADLADALLMGDCDIVHFGGHGAYSDGQGYASLNHPDGTHDWIPGSTLARLVINHRSVKLVVLNTCQSGQVNDSRAFQGMAPSLVRLGVPAVVAMQYPIHDEGAITFAREFYKRLCRGRGAGRVDVAITYARGMLAVLHAGERSWAAPVLYTHATDGRIYALPVASGPAQAVDPGALRDRLVALNASLEASQKRSEDYAMADAGSLFTWRQGLRRAEEAYRSHLSDPRPEVEQVARQGLTLVQSHLLTLGKALDAILA